MKATETYRDTMLRNAEQAKQATAEYRRLVLNKPTLSTREAMEQAQLEAGMTPGGTLQLLRPRSTEEPIPGMPTEEAPAPTPAPIDVNKRALEILKSGQQLKEREVAVKEKNVEARNAEIDAHNKNVDRLANRYSLSQADVLELKSLYKRRDELQTTYDLLPDKVSAGFMRGEVENAEKLKTKLKLDALNAQIKSLGATTTIEPAKPRTPRAEVREGEPKQEGEPVRIIVQDKDGNKFSLPADQLDEAIKQGYKKVEE